MYSFPSIKMTTKQDFARANNDSNKHIARKYFDAYYSSLLILRQIKGWKKVDFKANEESAVLDRMGCDTLVEKEQNCFKYYEEKYSFQEHNKDFIILELKTWQSTWNPKKKKSDCSKIDGWAVSEYKKTDVLLYYVHEVGLYIFPYNELRAWTKEQVDKGLKANHGSPDELSNENYKVHKDVLLGAVKHNFISFQDLEYRVKK